MIAAAIRDGILASVVIVGAQAVYCVYPERFPYVVLGGLVALLFYRKLDRIEVALSETRRHEEFRRRAAARRLLVVLLAVVAVLAGPGSYAVWRYLGPAR